MVGRVLIHPLLWHRMQWNGESTHTQSAQYNNLSGQTDSNPRPSHRRSFASGAFGANGHVRPKPRPASGHKVWPKAREGGRGGGPGTEGPRSCDAVGVIRDVAPNDMSVSQCRGLHDRSHRPLAHECLDPSHQFGLTPEARRP